MEISAATPEQPCLPIEHLLRWCRDVYPESAIASAMLTLAEDFRAAADVARASLHLPAQPDAPPGAQTELAGAEMHVWRRGWEGYGAAIAALVAERGMTGIRLVHEAEHRLVLQRALRSADRRLLVAGRELGVDVVDEDFLDLLRKRLLRHVDVAFVVEGFASADGPGPGLSALAREFRELRLVADRPTRARVLVADDMALISSFEFLSQRNYFEKAQGGRRRRSSHVGVLVRDPAFVDELLQVLGEAFPGELDGFGTSRPRPSALALAAPGAAATAEVATANQLLLQLEAAAPQDDRAVLVSVTVREADAPAALASLLFEADLPPQLLEAAAATVLLGGDGDSAVRARMRSFLVERAWAGDDFVAGAVLAGPGDPPAEIALLAAASGTAEFARAAERALEAGTALGAAALLGALAAAVDGHDDGAVLAEEGADELGPGAAAIVATLLDFAAAAPAPLPLHALELRTERTSAEEELEGLWQRLDEALRASRSRDLYPQWMNDVVAALHDEDGFGPLETAVERRDHGVVVAWVEKHGLDADHLLERCLPARALRAHLRQATHRLAEVHARGRACREAALALFGGGHRRRREPRHGRGGRALRGRPAGGLGRPARGPRERFAATPPRTRPGHPAVGAGDRAGAAVIARELLQRWPALVRHPQALVELGRGADALEPLDLLESVLLERTVRRDLTTTVEQLLDDGEWSVAAAAIEDFPGAESDEEEETLRATVAAERERVLRTLRIHLLSLRARAAEVAGPAVPDQIPVEHARSRTCAQRFLADLERKVREAERKRRTAIEVRIDDQALDEELRMLARDALEFDHLTAAEWFLGQARGGAAGVAHGWPLRRRSRDAVCDPREVPRRRRWGWSEPLHDAVEWVAGTTSLRPPDFPADWTARTTTRPARRLSRLCRRPPTPRPISSKSRR